MDWRCEWCGKPHEENDPPCDNCGHGSFEKAVVPVADSETELGSNATVWVCTECGREHPKHAPPCSRCGNETLVQQRQEVEATELQAPSYMDLVTPRYVLGLIAVLALGALFALGVAGIVPLPGFDTGVPTVSDVPGSADTAGDISLATVERSYLQNLNGERAAAGAANLTRDERLDEIATFINQRLVKAEFGDGQRPSDERVRELLGKSCDNEANAVRKTADGRGIESAVALAAAFQMAPQQEVAADATSVGVDVHTAPDGTLSLTQVTC